MKTSTEEYLSSHDREGDGVSDHQGTHSLSRHLLTNILLDSRKRKSSRFRTALVRILFLSVFIVAAGILGFIHGLHRGSPPSRTLVPELSYRDVVFAPDGSFDGGLDHKTVAAWDSLMPPGRGFVLVEDPSRFDLEPGIPTDLGIDRYSVSVFHQLHCLGLIRASYYSAKGGQDSVILHGGSHLNETVRNHIHGEHIDHCFDFIRQALMCAADTTIEPAAIEKNGKRIQVDGWGTLHKCRDWNALWEFMVQNQAPASVTGIA